MENHLDAVKKYFTLIKKIPVELQEIDIQLFKAVFSLHTKDVIKTVYFNLRLEGKTHQQAKNLAGLSKGSTRKYGKGNTK